MTDLHIVGADFIGQMSKPDQVKVLGELIRPLFAHRDPAIIGAVLADLLAMLLASHVGEDAAELREQLLELHIGTVRELIPVNEKLILAGVTPAGQA
jgi:hypothetical protein